MHIDSARELKADLLGSIVRLQPDRAALRRAGADAVRRTVAVGVTPRRRSQFRLALRVQGRGIDVEKIRRKAKGEVDVRYVGRVVRQASWNRSRQRPLRIGTSIGHFEITAGTLGCFVKLKRSGDMRVLSNNHVLANENFGQKGDVILQPGFADGGRRPGDVMGSLDKFVRLKKRGRNTVDAALAAISEKVKPYPTALRGVGTLKGVVDNQTDYEMVEKLGRTTGHTNGRITAFELDNLVVAYDLGNLRFDDQIEIEGVSTGPFSAGGDSGSLIFVSNEHLAVGLLFAGSDQGGSNGAGLTYANPFAVVLKALSAELALK